MQPEQGVNYLSDHSVSGLSLPVLLVVVLLLAATFWAFTCLRRWTRRAKLAAPAVSLDAGDFAFVVGMAAVLLAAATAPMLLLLPNELAELLGVSLKWLYILCIGILLIFGIVAALAVLHGVRSFIHRHVASAPNWAWGMIGVLVVGSLLWGNRQDIRKLDNRWEYNRAATATQGVAKQTVEGQSRQQPAQQHQQPVQQYQQPAQPSATTSTGQPATSPGEDVEVLPNGWQITKVGTQALATPPGVTRGTGQDIITVGFDPNSRRWFNTDTMMAFDGSGPIDHTETPYGEASGQQGGASPSSGSGTQGGGQGGGGKICGWCDGTGKCEACDGTGSMKHGHPFVDLPAGSPDVTYGPEVCDRCKGSKKCGICGGDGRL